MSTKNELLIRIDEKYPKFSKGQKRLADYIKENYDKAAFLTAAKMGEAVGVSESTVVRFATQLGYKGYPEFQKALGELVRTKLNSIQRMEVTYGRIDRSSWRRFCSLISRRSSRHWNPWTIMHLNWRWIRSLRQKRFM